MPNGFRAVRWIQPSVQSSVVVRSRRRVASRRVASPREKHDVSRASIVHDRASRASRSHTHLIMMYVRSVAMSSCRKVAAAASASKSGISSTVASSARLGGRGNRGGRFRRRYNTTPRARLRIDRSNDGIQHSRRRRARERTRTTRFLVRVRVWTRRGEKAGPRTRVVRFLRSGGVDRSRGGHRSHHCRVHTPGGAIEWEGVEV